MPAWDDKGAPAWTDNPLDRAEFAAGGVVVRPAQGTLTRPGRLPLRDRTKQQVALRVDPDVLDRFREGEPGWQGRINEALRKAVGL